MSIVKSGIVALAAVVGSLAIAHAPAMAQDFEKNILTGGPNGTYIQIGRDVSRLAANCGLTLNVRESAGSLENFLGVRKRTFTQFGIVQSDVLEYFRTFAADDPAIAQAVQGVRIAFPLYNEEVHILARKDVAGLGDLTGKRVAIGVQDSGTFLTASLVLDLAGVEPAERLTINADQSLAALVNNQIDAFFYVAGAPTKLFQSPLIDPERFHLLPIADPTLETVYVDTKIDAGTYPFQPEEVEVVAVKAVLMTFNYDRTKNNYHRDSCEAVSDVSNIILTNFRGLQETGHPKWQDVDLNDIPPGWNIGNCVNAGLSQDYTLECTAPEVVGTSIENEANSAYRDRICATIGC